MEEKRLRVTGETSDGRRDLNRRINRVSRVGRCEGEEEGQQGKAFARAECVEGREAAQSDGGNE